MGCNLFLRTTAALANKSSVQHDITTSCKSYFARRATRSTKTRMKRRRVVFTRMRPSDTSACRICNGHGWGRSCWCQQVPQERSMPTLLPQPGSQAQESGLFMSEVLLDVSARGQGCRGPDLRQRHRQGRVSDAAWRYISDREMRCPGCRAPHIQKFSTHPWRSLLLSGRWSAVK